MYTYVHGYVNVIASRTSKRVSEHRPRMGSRQIQAKAPVGDAQGAIGACTVQEVKPVACK